MKGVMTEGGSLSDGKYDEERVSSEDIEGNDWTLH